MRDQIAQVIRQSGYPSLVSADELADRILAVLGGDD